MEGLSSVCSSMAGGAGASHCCSLIWRDRGSGTPGVINHRELSKGNSPRHGRRIPRCGREPGHVGDLRGRRRRLQLGREAAHRRQRQFGTTASGGANNAGTMFEIQKTAGIYATAPTTLTSFGAGITPSGSGNLVEDAAGDLFGTTTSSVFEVQKTGGGYAAPVDLVPFPVGTALPTSCGRTRTLARCRSGTCTTTPRSAADLSAPIQGRRGRRSEPAISIRTAFPTSCCKTRTPAQCRSGRWMTTPRSAAAPSPILGLTGTPSEPGRRFRHPHAKHQRPNLDLGNGWEHDRRRRAGHPHSRLELASGRADLTPHNRRERLRFPEAGAIRSTHRPPWLRA
jgi:hypothetical protein